MAWIFVIPAFLIGCAGLDVRPVSDAANPHSANSADPDDSKANGIRYYEPAYFLIVYSDGAGSVKTDVLILPDTTRKMVAKPHNFLSKNKQTLSFTDGMLNDSAQMIDTTIVPAALIQAAQAAAEAAAKSGLLNAPSKKTADHLELNAPRIYKIVVQGSSVTLQGCSSSDTIKLPLTGS
jgi:hypothetical protein